MKKKAGWKRKRKDRISKVDKKKDIEDNIGDIRAMNLVRIVQERKFPGKIEQKKGRERSEEKRNGIQQKDWPQSERKGRE